MRSYRHWTRTCKSTGNQLSENSDSNQGPSLCSVCKCTQLYTRGKTNFRGFPVTAHTKLSFQMDKQTPPETFLLQWRAANIQSEPHSTLGWHRSQDLPANTLTKTRPPGVTCIRQVITTETARAEGMRQTGRRAEWDLHRYFQCPSPQTASWSLGWRTYRSTALQTQRIITVC